jgi:hypothetical protein
MKGLLLLLPMNIYLLIACRQVVKKKVTGLTTMGLKIRNSANHHG